MPGVSGAGDCATVLQFHHRLMLPQCLGGDVVRELEGLFVGVCAF